jgi:ribonuclease BN (tRNA processing enzyme)
MRFVVLGNCGAYPFGGGACSGYLLEQEGHKLLIDCGSGIAAEYMKRGADGLEGVVLSHLHGDHMSDILVLRYALINRTIRLWAPRTPQGLYDYLKGEKAFDLQALDQNTRIDFRGASLSFYPTAHPLECYATRIDFQGKSLVYTSDTNYCPDLAGFAQGADILVSDGCFSNAQWSADKPHLSAALAGKLAMEAGCGQLILTHFMPSSDKETLRAEAMAVCDRPVSLAEAGMSIEL